MRMERLINMKRVLLFLLLLVLLPVHAYGAEPREILYAHALSRAVNREPSISPLDRESRQLEARARAAMDKRAGLSGLEMAEADALYGDALRMRAESRRLERERSRLIVSVELSLRNYLANIAGLELDLDLLEKRLDLQELTLEHLRLRYYHGMASALELREAEHNLEQSRMDSEMLALALENERRQLNLLINHPVTANLRLIYDINYEPIPEDIDRFITAQAALDHNLLYWQDQVEVRRHDWQSRLDIPEVDNTYMRLQHQLAVLERNIAQSQAELAVRNTLANWERLQEQKQGMLADLAQAKADYEDMQSRFDAGLVTQVQVEAMAVAVAAQEARLAKHEYALWIARLRIDHPYARGGF